MTHVNQVGVPVWLWARIYGQLSAELRLVVDKAMIGDDLALGAELALRVLRGEVGFPRDVVMNLLEGALTRESLRGGDQ